MGEKEECGGSEKNKGRVESVDACAQACKGVSSMFALGTNDFGVNRCNSNGCKCLCETSAADDGTCNVVNHKGYRLYKFGSTAGMYYYQVFPRLIDLFKYCHICIYGNLVF